MKPIAAEWVSKVEGDFAILERECRARKNPSYDGACFHAQKGQGRDQGPVQARVVGVVPWRTLHRIVGAAGSIVTGTLKSWRR